MTCSDVRELKEVRARIIELELERDGLKSHINLFLKIESCDRDIREEFQLIKDLLPKQSLAEIQAKAVLDYEASLSSIHWTAQEYADQLRTKAKE